jgi:hypothetical protein
VQPAIDINEIERTMTKARDFIKPPNDRKHEIMNFIQTMNEFLKESNPIPTGKGGNFV